MIYLVILLLTLIVFLVRSFPSAEHLQYVDNAAMVLGLLMVSALVAGQFTRRRLSIPMLSGFILYGIAAGPFGLNIIRNEDIEALRFIDFIALSLIAITAGGELRWQTIRQRFRSYSLITIAQLFVISAGITGGLMLFRSQIPFFQSFSLQETAAVALVIGVLMVANSPATAIAIIKESNAQGENTDLVLGVAVFIDLIIVIFFAVAVTLAASLFSEKEGLSLLQTGSKVGGHIFFSTAIGGAVGALLIMGIRYLRDDLPMLVLLVVVFAFFSVLLLNLEAMLTLIVAGFVVQNFSRYGAELIHIVERSSLPFYIIFFTIAGARIDFTVLLNSWMLALSLVFLRMVLMFLATAPAVCFSERRKDSAAFLWLGYLSQAGVSLGLVTIIQHTFQGQWVADLSTTLVAVIAINQILGPILLKKSLDLLKESS
jgi:Kef-type K+ transport system membrane component KefB